MSHKLSTLLLLSACFLGMNASLWGQNAVPPHGVQGYLDPRTGFFHSIPHPDSPEVAEPAATTTYTGTLVVEITITVSSVFASTAPIGCIAGASLFEASTSNAIQDLGGSSVPRGTGTTVTCTVTIPYSWKLASGATDTVRLSYFVIAPIAGTTFGSTFPNRRNTESLGTIKVPVSGTTTTKTVKVRI